MLSALSVGQMLVAIVVAGAVAQAQGDSVLALRGATVHTATGQTIRNDTVVVRAGKIAAVGSGVAVPAGAQVVDLTGKEIILGIVDNHSHIGFPIAGLERKPSVPHIRALDMLDPNDPRFKHSLSGGVTTVVTGTAAAKYRAVKPNVGTARLCVRRACLRASALDRDSHYSPY